MACCASTGVILLLHYLNKLDGTVKVVSTLVSYL